MPWWEEAISADSNWTVRSPRERQYAEGMSVSSRLRSLIGPLADKLVYASEPYVEIKSTLNELGLSLMSFRDGPMGDADARLLKFLSFIRPMDSDKLDLVRIGGPHDGGYVMAAPLIAQGAISIGIGRDVSWDIDVSDSGVPVAMFDPTIRKPPRPVRGGRFFRKGLGDAHSSQSLRSLTSLVEMSGFSSSSDLLLKIDIEGNEWAALDDVEPNQLRCFTQIVMELHDLSRLGKVVSARPLLAAMEKLTAHHVPVHIHANNYSRLVRFDSFFFPDVVEVSLVRRDLYPRFAPARRLRTDLDAPCDHRASEISLAAILDLP